MEKHSNDWRLTANDGDSQGHDWARRQQNETRPQSAADKEQQNEEDSESADWGDVDPQHDPLIPPGPMDPSGPGSAV